MADFKFDSRAFEAAVEKAANDGVARLTAEIQRALDDVRAQHGGQPIDEIKPALARRFAQIEGTNPLTDPTLTEYASAIAVGQRIVMKHDKV